MKGSWRFMTCVIAGAALMLAAASFVTAGPNKVYPINAKIHGMTYGELAAEWWKWAAPIPVSVNPMNDPDGADCAINQPDKVWFLAGTPGTAETRDCTVPQGMTIFFPIVNYLNSYPCPDPGFEPGPGQTLEDFLVEDMAWFYEIVNVLEAELDGEPLAPDLFEFAATSGLFPFTYAADMVLFDPCGTGSPQLGATAGYWLALKPLAAGEHTLWFKGDIDGVFIVEATYNLTVE